ncbi:hypothetical protein ACHAXS_001560, partial [Conticribra weissflogii]
ESPIVANKIKLSAKDMLANERPYIIYGTAWKTDQTASLVSQAVRAGFRFIDTACQPKHYNEAGVGEGWTAAALELGLDRSDFFLQTKFTALSGQDPSNVPYDVNADLEDQVRQSVKKSLENLQTDYIDSLVLHSPMEELDLTMRVWWVFEELYREGKVKQLGISNCYDFRVLRNIYGMAKVKPAVVQNRFHDKTQFDKKIRGICDSLGIRYQSFWTLTANRKTLATTDWKSMATEKGLTPQTLMYAFMMTLGHIPLSGTTDPNHMQEDVDIMLKIQRGDQILTAEDVASLRSLLGMYGH